jgi:hypothetical protein
MALMETQQITALMAAVIARSFPALAKTKIKVTLVRNDGYIASSGHRLLLHLPFRWERAADIRFDAVDIAAMSPAALVGCIVHELVHIERDMSCTAFVCLQRRLWYLMSKVQRRVDEWVNDYTVMEKGYSAELLALHTYHDKTYGDDGQFSWITKEEIKQRADSEPARKWWQELLERPVEDPMEGTAGAKVSEGFQLQSR